MTVNSTNITSGPYTGTGSSSTFSYTFRVEDKTQLSVYETDTAGAITLLVVDTDYTVAGIGVDAGGVITRVAGNLPTGYSWYVRSNYPLTQGSSLSSQGGFFPDVHEKAFDKLAFVTQQLQDAVDRAAKLPDSYSGPASAELPAPAADKILQWNPTATALQNTDLGSVALATPGSGTVTADMISNTAADKQAITAKLEHLSTLAGAVARTQRDKNDDTVNAADFGFSTSATAAANKTALQAALDTGRSIDLGEGTFNLDRTIQFAVDGQTLRGAGRSRTALVFTAGTAGQYALSVRNRNFCAGYDFSVNVTTGENALDFGCDTGNCISNHFQRVTFSGAGKGATPSTNTYTGVRFDKMVGALACFFNVVSDCDFFDFNTNVLFDADAGNPTFGGNANSVLNCRMEKYWYAYRFRSIECRVEGGFFNQSGGNATDKTIAYKFENGCSLNYVAPAVGEPGNDARPYEIDAGCNNNFILPHVPFNFPLAGTDADGRNITPASVRTSRKAIYQGLSETTFYKVALTEALSTNISSEIDFQWASYNATTLARTSGSCSIKAHRSTGNALVTVISQTNSTNGLGAASLAGFEIAGNIVYAMFQVSNNGTSTASCTLRLSGSYAGGIALEFGPTAEVTVAAPSPVTAKTANGTFIAALGVGNTVANANTPSGTTAYAWELKDQQGNVLGYTPIYGSPW